MNARIAKEIQAAQRHGRAKYGDGPNDLKRDDRQPEGAWHRWIEDHNGRAAMSTPMDRRDHLIKVAGLAVSAVEAFDRNWKRKQNKAK